MEKENGGEGGEGGKVFRVGEGVGGKRLPREENVSFLTDEDYPPPPPVVGPSRMDMEVRVIAFMGGIGVGKSTAASITEELIGSHYRLKRVSFAEPIKKMVEVLGVPRADIDDRTVRERPHPRLAGRSIRWALQTLGTEWGRDMIHQDIWVKTAARDICDFLAWEPKGVVVIDDLRFLNEAEAVKRMSGVIVRIVKKFGVEFKGVHGHSSERASDSIRSDIIVENDLDLGQLKKALRSNLRAFDVVV